MSLGSWIMLGLVTLLVIVALVAWLMTKGLDE